MPSGNGRPRATSSRLSAAFSPCNRAISFSSAVRSSGSAWQAQPTARLLHRDTSPVRVSSRNSPSDTCLNVNLPCSVSSVGSCACATGARLRKNAKAATADFMRHPLLREACSDLRRPNDTADGRRQRSEEHTSELQSLAYLVCRLLLEKKKKKILLLFLYKKKKKK